MFVYRYAASLSALSSGPVKNIPSISILLYVSYIEMQCAGACRSGVRGHGQTQSETWRGNGNIIIIL